MISVWGGAPGHAYRACVMDLCHGDMEFLLPGLTSFLPKGEIKGKQVVKMYVQSKDGA